MRKTLKTAGQAVLVFGVPLLIAGCGGSGGQVKQAAEKPPEPLTLKVLQYSTDITDNDFQKLLADPVKKKYPHLTLELVRLAKGTTLQDLVASGDVPDLIYTGSRQIDNFKNVGIPSDLNELIKRNKYDLSALNADAVNIIKQRGEKGEVYALPIFLNFSALYYNKDIFDKFGVPYPKDGMTWEDIIALGKKVARTENGVTYKPLNPNAFVNFGAPYQVNYVNPDNDAAVINNEPVKKSLTLYKQITELPGNKDAAANARSRFQKEQDLAMQPDFAELLGELAESGQSAAPMNWDVVSYPSFADAPGLGYESIAFMLMISSTGKHPDEAFHAIQAITSADNQLKLARGGKVPALKDPQLLESFGADVPGLQGKNVKGIFKSKPSPSPRRSKYEDVARPVLNAYVQKVVNNETDINSALRQAEEEANGKIASQKK